MEDVEEVSVHLKALVAAFSETSSRPFHCRSGCRILLMSRWQTAKMLPFPCHFQERSRSMPLFPL